MVKRLLPLALVVTSLAIPSAAAAVGSSLNEIVGSFELVDDLVWHRYDTGPRVDVEPSAADTFVDTVRNSASPGVVELDRFITGSNAPDVATVAWFDLDRRARRCVSVTGSGLQFIDLAFDSTDPVGWEASGLVQGDWGDFLPVLDNGATTSTPPFWLATPFDTDDGHAFVRVDFAAVGSPVELCAYFASELGGRISASNPQLGQNWGTMEALYTRNNTRTGDRIWISNPTLTTVRVATTAVGPTTPIAPGEVITYDMGASTTLFADGVVSTRGRNTVRDDDSLAPTTFSANLFVSPTRRETQTWCFGDTPVGNLITINPSSGSAVNYIYNPLSPCAVVDTTGATVLSAGTAFNVHHTADRNDNYVLYEPTSDWLYGVASQQHYVATDTPGTTVLRQRSDGTSTIHTISANGANIGGSGSQGIGPSERIRATSAGRIAAIQQDDSDGDETTTFLPISELSARYVINRTARYVTIACVQPGQALTIGGSPVVCAGTGLGHYREANVATGTVIEAVDGAAFYLYAEVGNDETNYFSPRLDWDPIDLVLRPIESLYAPGGTWTAVGGAMTEVWGLLRADIDLPAATAVTTQIACGPSAAGPWTPAAAWVSGGAVPHDCDGVGFVQITATLTATDRTQTPSVLDVTVEYDLVRELDSIAPFDLVATGQTWLWRVHDHSGFYATQPTDMPATAAVTSGDYVLALVDQTMSVSDQVVAAGGGVVDGGGPDVVLHVSSIRADVTVLPSGVDDHEWSFAGGPGVTRIVRLS